MPLVLAQPHAQASAALEAASFKSACRKRSDDASFPENGVFGNYDPPQIKLAQKWRWLQWNAATEWDNNMLPLVAVPKNY
jgi:hypothetical protein